MTGRVMDDPAEIVREAGDLRLAVPPLREAALAPEAIPLDIRHEDAALIVVNKPRGMTVHPGAGIHGGTLVNALLHHCRGSLRTGFQDLDLSPGYVFPL